MEYISAAEIAQKWGVSPRQVQRLLTANRIPDVKKYGRSWMIPADSAKPGDLRTRQAKRGENEKPHSNRLADFEYFAALPASWPPVNLDTLIDTMNDEETRLLYRGLVAYCRGDFSLVTQCYAQLRTDAAKLHASTFTLAAAISEGDYAFYKEIELFLKELIRQNLSAAINGFAELSFSTAYLGAMAPGLTPKWIKDGDFSALSASDKPEAAYRRAKYFQCIGDYRSMLNVAQTALAFSNSPAEMSLSGLYLQLMCAIACYNLNRVEDSRRWLLDAMHRYLPFGIISPFSQLVSSLGGLMERLLQEEYPGHYEAVIRQWHQVIPHWVAFHNRFTMENIPSILTLREVHVAELAVRGASYKEIADHFHISVGRLKNVMHRIYGKLLIKTRKELAKYILKAP